MTGAGLRQKLLRVLFVLSVFALETAWVVILGVGAFKFYAWLI